MKSDLAAGFYLPQPIRHGAREHFESTFATSGPWSPQAQHGGPPAALLGRALEQLEPDLARVLGRFTMDLLGPVPVGPVSVEARVLRPGRSVSLREAVLYDDTADRPVARAQAWAFPLAEDGPLSALEPPGHSPADGRLEDLPTTWSRGYLDAMEWRWIRGAVTRPGDAVVWMRPRLPLVPGEVMTPWQRLLCCVDSASGVSAVLDPTAWTFLNPELSVHVARPPEGQWVCLEAATLVGPGAVGLATSRISDERGFVGRSAQVLLVAPTS